MSDALTLGERALLVLLDIESHTATTGDIARGLAAGPYTPEREVLRPTLAGLQKRRLLRNTPHPKHGRWTLTATGVAEARSLRDRVRSAS